MSSARLPSLDGLRAVSIALVLVSHLVGTPRFPVDARALGAVGDIGYLGVRVFFVISGFLITSLLLAEHARTRTVSLRGFYVRRFWRIFPAFYAFVAVMAVAWAAGALRLSWSDLVAATTYTMNYHYDRSWELGHIWSLSVEEQFYLLWPALFLLAGPRRVVPVAVAMIALAPALRALAWFVAPARDDVILEAYPCVMDAIAAGCLLAAVRPRLDRSATYLRFLRSPWFALVPAIVIAANLPAWFALEYTTHITIMNLGVALCVDRCVRFPDGWTGRALNAAPLVWLGGLSYSLYLWQEPFLNPHGRMAINTFPLNLALAVACALASSYLIERPILAWRARRAAAGSA
ncbi:MAG: acyltransferase [Kofleriaceae bacterium]|nr:acyltransferase [Kofleriaceae bacterium]MCL4223883.1 acyltransferase [Myxococcales bacterium]